MSLEWFNVFLFLTRSRNVLCHPKKLFGKCQMIKWDHSFFHDLFLWNNFRCKMFSLLTFYTESVFRRKMDSHIWFGGFMDELISAHVYSIFLFLFFFLLFIGCYFGSFTSNPITGFNQSVCVCICQEQLQVLNNSLKIFSYRKNIFAAFISNL